MEKIDALYNNIKDLEEKEINGILKDLIIIDGAIVQDSNLEYKKDMFLSLEEKYKKELEELMYHKVKDIVDEKTDKFVESNIKAVNTMLGNLKTMLIRVAAITVYYNDKIKNIIKDIKKENDPKEIYILYGKLDDELLNHIS